MKKVILMMVIFVVMAIGQGVWLPAPNKQFIEGDGYIVTSVYPVFSGVETSRSSNSVFFTVKRGNETLMCRFAFDAEAGTTISDRAKMIYSTLLTAFSTGSPISMHGEVNTTAANTTTEPYIDNVIAVVLKK